MLLRKKERRRGRKQSLVFHHLKLDAMKKAFAHTNEEVVTEADPRRIYQSE